MDHRNLLRPFARLLFTICLAIPLAAAAATESFVVRDIQVEGLERLTEGTLFNYLPLNIGDELTPARAAQSVRALFDTGFFHDIELHRDGDTLLVRVVERPTIAHFRVEGNKDIEDEELRNVLRGVGLAEGRIFNRAVLENVELELNRQYFSRGKYGVIVDTEVTDIGNNMVSVRIDISEGEVARIRQINITGNETFEDEVLLDELELRTPNWLSWYRKDDQYAREKLQADIETLASYYMDRGFADFDIDSTQVAISPDKQDIYITINISEGEQYTFGEIQFAGELITTEEDLRRYLQFQPGQGFSRRAVTDTADLISARLGEEGYSFAEVSPLPQIDHDERVVDIVMHVEPGKRIYVRRINFSGGLRTNDETFRREMRQLEGGFLSDSALERSRIRLQRLQFVEEVEIDTQRVPGTDDLVDINVEIEERTPGNFNFGVGYSSAFKTMLNVGVEHTNFLGEGKHLALDLNRSAFSEDYRINYTNPYHTPEGVSRTLGVFYQDVDQLFARTSQFLITSAGVNISYGIPITEYTRINVGATVRDTELTTSPASSDELRRWVTNPDHGENFSNPDAGVFGTGYKSLEINAGWVNDTRNRAIFPTRGSMRRVELEYSTPAGELEFLLGRAVNQSYFPVSEDFTFTFRGEVAAGKAFGGASSIPPNRNFFGGGPESIRGWREYWLGPRDSNDRPFGGNIKLFGQAELLFAPPHEEMRKSTRFSLFYDVGNVFLGRSNVEFDELRMSVGLGITWLAPLGALKFSYAHPINAKPGDEVERFQFSIGSSF